MATKAKFATCNTADDDLIAGDLPAIDRLVAAFLRIRGLDRLDDAVSSRYWLATDIGVTAEDLDDLLSLLRWRGLIKLPNDHLVTVRDATVLKAMALAESGNTSDYMQIFSPPTKFPMRADQERNGLQN